MGAAVNRCWQTMQSYLRFMLGSLLNWAGAPGLVRAGDYRDASGQITLRIRCFGAFTVITVNCADVRFRRLTGRFAGVGVPPGSGARSEDAELQPEARAAMVGKLR